MTNRRRKNNRSRREASSQQEAAAAEEDQAFVDVTFLGNTDDEKCWVAQYSYPGAKIIKKCQIGPCNLLKEIIFFAVEFVKADMRKSRVGKVQLGLKMPNAQTTEHFLYLYKEDIEREEMLLMLKQQEEEEKQEQQEAATT